VRYLLLPWIIEQEGKDFQQIDYRWRPTSLLMVQQVRILLKDMRARYEHLDGAREEMATLIRADKYVKFLSRMRLWLRQAHIVWKSNQLAFLQATEGFYTDYGAVLRLLKYDEARGQFTDRQPQVKGV
jgi:hypothetical protein